MVIKVKNLVKEFDSLKAVDDISFEVKKGEIFGLLGPNGAGKTTTIRMLTGIFKPAQGNAYIGKYDIQKNPIEAKQLMGIVPEMANAYIDLSAFKNLLLMGELYGIEKEKRIRKAENLLKLFQLYEKRNQKVRTFSKGMKQRVILAMALMNDSKILFLDEPTSGLDVESARLIKNLIRKFNEKGVTILLTTHNIEEANQLCDRVAIMDHGKIIAIDRPAKLKHAIQGTSSIEVAFKEPVNKDLLKFKGVTEVKKIGDKFKLYTEKPEDIIPILVNHSQKTKNKIISLNTFGPSLEDVFVKLTKGRKK
ncbi:ATP-binding cassette domain-containing protein [Candidatus Woesearchaeota archaeon]|nr:ATP-binding cassette domain-containing protein [Candidatus Woesearchaeota archaeon]